MASQPHTGDKPADLVEVLIFENPVHLSKDADETPDQPFETEMKQEEELGELEEDTGTTCWGGRFARSKPLHSSLPPSGHLKKP